MPKPIFEDHSKVLAEIIRVDHAGEYGAKRIYEGQIAFAQKSEDRELIQEMMEQEDIHLRYFVSMAVGNAIRPTALMPLWHFMGYALGSVSAMAGTRYAMLVTNAVEEVIEQHYQKQIDILNDPHVNLPNSLELRDKIRQFQEDEVSHKNTASSWLKNSSFEQVLAIAVRTICKTTIFLSKKI